MRETLKGSLLSSEASRLAEDRGDGCPVWSVSPRDLSFADASRSVAPICLQFVLPLETIRIETIEIRKFGLQEMCAIPRRDAR